MLSGFLRLAAIAIVGGFIATFASISPASSADPAPNQLVSQAALCAMIAEGELRLVNGKACAANQFQAISLSLFTTLIQNNGACSAQGVTTGLRMPVLQDFINCRLLAGAVSVGVSGGATGPVPLTCHGTGDQQTCTGPSPASPLDVSTSSTTVAPSGTTAISWNVTMGTVVGTCHLSLLKGSTTLFGPAGLGTGGNNTNSYTTTSSGSGVYTLEIACTSNNAQATVSSGTFGWFQ